MGQVDAHTSTDVARVEGNARLRVVVNEDVDKY